MHISFHFIVVYLAAVCLGFFLHFNSYLLSRCLLLPFPFPALMNAHCTQRTHCTVCVCVWLSFFCAALHHALVYYVIMLEFSAGSAAFVYFSGYIWPFFRRVLFVVVAVRSSACLFLCLPVRPSLCLWLVNYKGQRLPPQITMLQNAASFHREHAVTFFEIVPTAHAELKTW